MMARGSRGRVCARPRMACLGSEKGTSMAAQESEVTKEGKAAWEVGPRVDLHRFPIQVMTDGDGGLRLEGEVESIAAKRVALVHAQRVCGNKRVIDALRLVPTEARGDGEIRDAFTRGLQQQPE